MHKNYNIEMTIAILFTTVKTGNTLFLSTVYYLINYGISVQCNNFHVDDDNIELYY